MPGFQPFPGLRYNAERADLSAVIAPPYDVIDDDERARLESKSPYNAVHLELARPDPGPDPYRSASEQLDGWIRDQILVTDPQPCFYLYRMGFHDEQGQPRQTTGVIGALELTPPESGEVLPHERTMPKPKDDRLNLLRACRANLSPVWCLSLAEGLSGLLPTATPPIARCTDDDGVHHRLWSITEPALVEAIASVVASAPAVMADGHHRYETALAYREERYRDGAGPGDHDFMMAYMVELSDEQLSVRPIHRLLSGLPAGYDVAGALSAYFDVADAGPPASDLQARMAGAGALGLVTAGRTWLLRPRQNATGESAPATTADSGLLEAALPALPPHELAFHHSVEQVLALVDKGDVQAAVLLRPVPVSEIARVARARERLPEKTTFFHPKLRTGLVFRRLV